MSAREIIRLIDALPEGEFVEVLAFVEAKKSAVAQQASASRLSFQDAKKHVFTQYGDLLERLAK